MNCHAVLLVLAGASLSVVLAAPHGGGDAKPARVPVLLDTDIGDDIDDAFALALQLASPEVELRGVTTVFGDAHTRARLVRRLLDADGRKDIPVASGQPPRAKPETSGQMQYGLHAGIRAIDAEPAVDFLYRRLKAHPGELTLLAIGPLTNVADLLTRHPDCQPWIKRVVLMGGSVHRGYKPDTKPEPEWNIKCDVKAAQVVFMSGVPLTVAPLDATADVKLEAEARRKVFAARTPLTEGLEELYRLWGRETPVLFDPVAAALCFTDELCKMEELQLRVDDRGMTRPAGGKANARVATAVRRDRFIAWYVGRVAKK